MEKTLNTRNVKNLTRVQSRREKRTVNFSHYMNSTRAVEKRTGPLTPIIKAGICANDGIDASLNAIAVYDSIYTKL